jgi:hypothetical protein
MFKMAASQAQSAGLCRINAMSKPSKTRGEHRRLMAKYSTTCKFQGSTLHEEPQEYRSKIIMTASGRQGRPHTYTQGWEQDGNVQHSKTVVTDGEPHELHFKAEGTVD